MNFGPVFKEYKFLTGDISDIFYHRVVKFGMLGVWPMDTWCLNLVNYGLVLRGGLWPTFPYLGQFLSERNQILHG